MEELRDRREAEQRFQADLHGAKLQERDGRVHGLRQQQMARMKSRQRGGH